MADAASIKVIKTIAFKGGTQHWSNRYHFDGGAPADLTKWAALSDAVVAAEKAIFPNWISIVQTFGYEGGSEASVFTKTYAQAGTATGMTGPPQASEVVAIGRWPTTKRTSKNHPVYLFSYWHGVYTVSLPSVDGLDTVQKGFMQTYMNSWVTGFSDGAVSHHRSGPDETLALAGAPEAYVTHRDFR